MTTKDFIEELERELHYINEEGITLHKLRAIIHNVKEMDAALTTAKEALEFYSDPFSWHDNEYGTAASVIEWDDYFSESDCKIGGKRAREALAKIKETKK